MIRISVIVENNARPGFLPEHGLALRIEANGRTLLFDTGAGIAYPGNEPQFPHVSYDGVILSHGHGDHTGGLCAVPSCRLWHGPEIAGPHYSHHPGKPVRNIAMPAECVAALARFQCETVSAFREILPGFFLTGPIPRESGETAGGPFYHDDRKCVPDCIPEEQALLLSGGLLIQGCCHAGIINTLEYCRKHAPENPVRAIFGGLHLLHADEARLKETADYLLDHNIRDLYLMHCTGENAIAYLRDRGFRIVTPCAGDVLEIPRFFA